MCISVSKRALPQNLSYENDFVVHENDPVEKPFSYRWFPHERKRQLANGLLAFVLVALLFAAAPCSRDSKVEATVHGFHCGFQFGLYHVVAVFSFLRSNTHQPYLIKFVILVDQVRSYVYTGSYHYSHELLSFLQLHHAGLVQYLLPTHHFNSWSC